MKLGPSRKTPIPREVTINGEVKTDHASILGKWKDDFENLYKSSDENFDSNFKAETLANRNPKLPKESAELLNKPITIQDLEYAVSKAK